MIPTASLKAKLRSGGVSLGAWLRLGSPAAAELVGQLGFDWVVIEGEHAAAGPETVQQLLMALRGSPTIPIVRVPENNRNIVKVMLDVGVQGIMFPMINNAEEAAEAVRACKYPPAGVRGIGPGRACDFGLDQAEYMRQANDDTLVFIIVEHERAVANVESILAVPGIDGVFFGYADYGASLGLTGQFDHPRVLAARATVLAAARRAGVIAGHDARTPAHARDLIAQGVQLLTVGSDSGFIIEGAQGVLQALRPEA